MSSAERLVGLGFRCWLAGYQTGDIGCWETAWNAYASALGPARAKAATSELSCWVRLVNDAARRPIEIFPPQCRGFCRDERLAISMVAASQHSGCPAIRACAIALLDNVAVDDVIDSARSFAVSLRQAELILPPVTVFEGFGPPGGGCPVSRH